jgi:Skp family chaperone for outer membrane proteins
MKRTIRCFAVLVILWVAMPVVAGKIGFVDAERAVTQVEQGKIKIQELEAWATPQRERLEQMAGIVRDLQSKLQTQRMVAQPEALEKMAEDERRARRDLEDAGRAFEQELSKKQNEFLADVAVKVGKVAADYGEANDYDAIFVLKAQPLIYLRESCDLTDLVIRLYNERFPVQ